jgi:hypothetical protein
MLYLPKWSNIAYCSHSEDDYSKAIDLYTCGMYGSEKRPLEHLSAADDDEVLEKSHLTESGARESQPISLADSLIYRLELPLTTPLCQCISQVQISPILGMASDMTSKLLFTLCRDRKLMMWSVPTLNKMHEREEAGMPPITHISVHPGNEYICTSSWGYFTFINTSNFSTTFRFKQVDSPIPDDISRLADKPSHFGTTLQNSAESVDSSPHCPLINSNSQSETNLSHSSTDHYCLPQPPKLLSKNSI